MRVLVVGGSLGGLFAANLLLQAGHDVRIYERAPHTLAGRGAGLGTRDELFTILRRLGIDHDRTIGVEVLSRICLDREGQRTHEIPISSVTTAWDRLYHALKSAFPADRYHAGTTLQRVEQHRLGVVAHFADHSTSEGDLLVAADGVHSAVRRQLLPEAAPHYAGYYAWRGTINAEDMPSALRALVLNHMVFAFPPHELALSFPLPPRSTGSLSRRCQVSWFRPADETTLRRLVASIDASGVELSIPPQLIGTALLGALKADAASLLPWQIETLIGQLQQPILQPIFDWESSRLAFGRVVLLGDAAFVARPHVGTGVSKAALDAQCLADALGADDDIARALARYEKERHRFGAALVARGRYLGARLEARDEQAALSALPPERMMREFGAAGIAEAIGDDRPHIIRAARLQ
jgi:2-polyprenyl-6-methoxyphenol hydroxylase-like FAD-dependent oxidoreductase